MQRRQFIERIGLAAASAWYPLSTLAVTARTAKGQGTNNLSADVVIVGGGLGGCAAALAASRAGLSVILTEPTDWIGGQLTQQAVPPDEHKWIETTGCTSSYRQFRERIRDYYRRNYPLTEAARNNKLLNPGNGSVSRLCHEPRVALAVLDELLAAYISAGRLTFLLNAEPFEATLDGDRIQAIRFGTQTTGSVWVKGTAYIDATEQGDLLPLAKTEFVIGTESHKQTGEPHAPEIENSANIQSFAWCFAMDYVEGEDHTIERPTTYEFWRDQIPQLKPAWSGKLLSLMYSSPRTLEPKKLAFVPPSNGRPAPRTTDLNLWLYRRIIDPANFLAGTYSSGATIVNWPQNDYMLGNIVMGGEAEIAKHLEGSRQLSLSLLYWLQTEAPRPDGGSGWKGLRLRPDIVGTADGLAKFPYIRESRRIVAEFTILEQHIARESRSKLVAKQGNQPRAEVFPDSVGIGYYHLDLHPSSGGDNYIDTESLPFQIPLGALIPQRVDNLIAGCKNIGTTHISNGCYRLHPVEWSIGETAGALAAYCIEKHESPRGVRNRASSLRDFQNTLIQQGIELSWPESILAG